MSNLKKDHQSTVATPVKSALEIPKLWQSIFYRFFTLPNITGLLLCAMALIAWNRGLALLYGMVAALLAFILLSAILPWIYLRRLHLAFEQPISVHAGQTQAIHLHINTQKNKKIYGIQFTPAMASVATFYDSAQPTQCLTYAAGQALITFNITPTQRGCFHLQHVKLTCAYPFGLITIHKNILATPCLQTVYPKLLNIKHLPPSWLHGAVSLGEQMHRNPQGYDLFVGLRQYRTGDNYRHIDWRATARSGDITLREFEQLEQPCVSLVINADDTFNIGHGQINALEHSLSLAASIAKHCLMQGITVNATGAIDCHINSVDHLDDFYTLLTQLPAQTQNHYSEYLAHTLSSHNHSGIVISFINQGSLEATPPTYHSHTQKHWQFIFNDESYLNPLKTFKRPTITHHHQTVSIPVYANHSIADTINNND